MAPWKGSIQAKLLVSTCHSFGDQHLSVTFQLQGASDAQHLTTNRGTNTNPSLCILLYKFQAMLVAPEILDRLGREVLAKVKCNFIAQIIQIHGENYQFTLTGNGVSRKSSKTAQVRPAITQVCRPGRWLEKSSFTRSSSPAGSFCTARPVHTASNPLCSDGHRSSDIKYSPLPCIGCEDAEGQSTGGA